jgi:hypothetical protein
MHIGTSYIQQYIRAVKHELDGIIWHAPTHVHDYYCQSKVFLQMSKLPQGQQAEIVVNAAAAHGEGMPRSTPCPEYHPSLAIITAYTTPASVYPFFHEQ